jgi:hypothetical protein
MWIEFIVVCIVFFLMFGKSLWEDSWPEQLGSKIGISLIFGAIVGIIFYGLFGIITSSFCAYEYVPAKTSAIYKNTLTKDGVEIDSYYVWKDGGFRVLVDNAPNGIIKYGVDQSQIKFTPNEPPRYIYYKPQYVNKFLRENVFMLQGSFSEIHIPDKYIKLDLNMGEKQN